VPNKQWRTIEHIHEDLKGQYYEGAYDRMAMFAKK